MENAKVETKFDLGPLAYDLGVVYAERGVQGHVCRMEKFFNQETIDAYGSLFATAPALYEENERLKKLNTEMLDTLVRVRAWYEAKHDTLLKGITPVCFSEALSVIQKATQP